MDTSPEMANPGHEPIQLQPKKVSRSKPGSAFQKVSSSHSERELSRVGSEQEDVEMQQSEEDNQGELGSPDSLGKHDNGSAGCVSD